MITSIISTISAILFGLSITIKFLVSSSKKLKFSSISSVVLKYWFGISVIPLRARGCLPPPGTFWLTIISLYILSSGFKWCTSPEATIIFPLEMVVLIIFWIFSIISPSDAKSPLWSKCL